MDRILHIVGRMNRAGAETMLMNLYRKLDRSKYQFDFVYFTDEHCDYDNEIIELGGKIYRIPYTAPIGRTFGLYKLIKKQGPFHAIQCHQMFSNSLHLLAAYFGKINMRIAHSHNTSDSKSNKLIGKMYHAVSKSMISRFSTHFIACGENAGKFLFPNNDNVVFLPNAVNLDTFIKNEDRAINFLNADKIGNQTVVITQIGRLSSVKNHKFTLRLAKYLKSQSFDFHLAIVGSGGLENELKALATEYDINDKVTFCGVRDDIDHILKTSSLMIMPSLFEGFPVVLVESQASGIPALISSNISPEVDLGMGLISFCDITANNEVWFNEIKTMTTAPEVKPAIREQVLSDAGYNINISIKKLEKFYKHGK